MLQRTDSTVPSKEEVDKLLQNGDLKVSFGAAQVFEDGSEEHKNFLRNNTSTLIGADGGIENNDDPYDEASKESIRLGKQVSPAVDHSGVGSWQPGMNTSSTAIEKITTKDITHMKDPICCGNLKWAVVSLITPPQSNNMALKISGAFTDEEAANKYAKELMDALPYFDMYVVSMNHWCKLPISDDERLHMSCQYKDKDLQRIMDNFRNEQIKSRTKTRERILETKESAASGSSGNVQKELLEQTHEVEMVDADF